MSAERFTLDTNVLVYALDRRAGDRHRLARDVIGRAIFGDCRLTLQAVSEFYAVAVRKRMVLPAEAHAQACDWLDSFATAAASAAAVRAALATAAAGRMSYWDALLLITAAEAGCTAILTDNLADGTTLHGVRVLNPFTGDALPAEVRQLLAAA
jgi:predicted nucleic acid-binding protein